MNLTKKDICKQMAEKYGYTQKAANEFINDFFDTVCENLRVGDIVNIHGYCCFDMLYRQGRNGTNPQTGEAIAIPPKWVSRVYPYTKLKDAVAEYQKREEAKAE